MRVLHVWNTAGVASVIAKFMDRIYGTESFVVTRRQFDPYGLTTVGERIEGGKVRFMLASLRLARKCDLIHVHAMDSIIPFLNVIFPGKPVILHYHGSNIRGQWSRRERYWKNADVILVSTTDLFNGAPSSVRLLPNPVDTDLFKLVLPRAFKPGSAMTMSYRADDLAATLAQEKGLVLKIFDRKIPYLEMPDLLRQFEFYIDIRRGEDGQLLRLVSKTALEALASGLKVIDWTGAVLEGLPRENSPEEAARSLYEIYSTLTTR